MTIPRRSAFEEKYNSTLPHLKDVLADIDCGRTVVPQFHRKWCWQDKHIHRLIASVAEGAPIGSATFMEARPISHRAFEGVRLRDERVPPVHLVLDGQQRLTALYLICNGQEPVRIATKNGFEYRQYYFQMGKAADVNVPLEDAILSISTREDGSPIAKREVQYSDPLVQYAQGIFPTNMLFDFKTYERDYCSFWDTSERQPTRQDAVAVLYEFRSAIIDTFENYKVPVQTLNKNVPIDEIVRIFEDLNRAA